MKYLWMWCLTNTIVIVLLLMMIHTNIDIQNQSFNKVSNMELRLNAYECQKDTIVVNVINRIEIPKNKK